MARARHELAREHRRRPPARAGRSARAAPARRARPAAARGARARPRDARRRRAAAHARELAAGARGARRLDQPRRAALRPGARGGPSRAARRARALDARTSSRRSCSPPATTPRCPRRSRGIDGVAVPRAVALHRGARRARAPTTPPCPRSAPTRSASPSWTASSTSTASGSRPDALALLQEAREEHARAAGLVALSAAHDAELEVAGLGGELKPFQRAGVAYLLERRRAFLADEQGLGKTIEALAALQADDAFPAVVVCPANLKLNWLREARAWLPGAQRRALVGARRGRARRRGRGRHPRRGVCERRGRAPEGAHARRHHDRQLRHPRRASAGAARGFARARS